MLTKQVKNQAANDPLLIIKYMTEFEISTIVASFSACGLSKQSNIFEQYLLEQDLGIRVSWVAYYDNVFAGYNTLKWDSDYAYFRQNKIPEIKDLNVIPPFRSKGIGSTLLDVAEHKAFKVNDIVGLGVGLYADYGSAQRLYIKRGYIPDGRGITYNYLRLEQGQMATLDDELILWMTKHK